MRTSTTHTTRARLDALERRHTGPPPREDWLEARFGGRRALAGLRNAIRKADAGRAAAFYRRAIARLRGNLTAPDLENAELVRLAAALAAARNGAAKIA